DPPPSAGDDDVHAGGLCRGMPALSSLQTGGRPYPGKPPNNGRSCLGQRLRDDAIEALAGRDRLESQTLVNLRRHAHHEFSAVVSRLPRPRQPHAVLVQKLDPFLGRPAKLAIDLCFIPSMHAAQEERGTAAYEALVLVAPLDELWITGRQLLDLALLHGLLRHGF